METTGDKPQGKRGTRHRGGPGGQSRSARAAAGTKPQRRRTGTAPTFAHLTFPENLPVSAHRNEIAAAIAAHQVVILSGQTGSGKTTQLPKICLQLGRGHAGLIGHTQPRRLAARTVAQRIAAEIGEPLGKTVGYQVRFNEQVSQDTRIKLMTDGILLNEIQTDPLLTKYDTIIVDEAHERSLNIDFILGYLAQLLPQRRDLKVIITSATIDAQRFAEHFARSTQPGDTPPCLNVEGRTFPVEIRYRPLDTEDDQVSAICAAVDELLGADRQRPDSAHTPGDILIFLPGERDIRDTVDGLADHLGPRYLAPSGAAARPDAIEVLPLYARLSNAEQLRVFQDHGWQRIVLATNVAETSLTVPGIRYVIDPGLARISRYSNRTKVQRLPIEEISQASANQRSGRCGRLADGIAIRLYDEANFQARPTFTEPEIQRTSLAAVILQMLALGLGDVTNFPFIDPPDARAIRDGVNVLVEVGALAPIQRRTRPQAGTATMRIGAAKAGGGIGGEYRLTRIGRDLARLPIDPRLGRILIEGHRNGCADQVVVIVAALSMQDVRERPAESAPSADAAHERFVDIRSDFTTYLNLWRYLRTQARDLSNSAFRRLCRAEYLHYLRVREWFDVVTQLRQMAGEIGIDVKPLQLPSQRDIDTQTRTGGSLNATARAAVALTQTGKDTDTDTITRSILVGLLSNIGAWNDQSKDYEAARGSHFVIWPGSGLRGRNYDWIVGAELVETSRLFARTVARIEPAWIEELAGPMLKRTYSEPFWSRRHGAAMVHERVSFFGLTLSADRQVQAARTRNATAETKDEARTIFIREALVNGNWRSHHKFLRTNTQLVEAAQEWERRRRQVGYVADPGRCYDFFAARIPADIYSGADFDRWWNKARTENPQLLDYTETVLFGDTHARGRSSTESGAQTAATPVSFGAATRTDIGARTGIALADILNAVADHPYANTADFPDTIAQLPLSYRFQPGQDDDGVTVSVPLEIVPQLDDSFGQWLVPGMFADLCTGLIKALPKRIRRDLVPAPDVGQAVARWIEERGLTPWDSRFARRGETATTPSAQPAREQRSEAAAKVAAQQASELEDSLARLANWGGQAGIVKTAPTTTPAPDPTGVKVPAQIDNPVQRGDLQTAFMQAVAALRGVVVDVQAWEQALSGLPAHLRLRFAITTGKGVIDTGRDLAKLRRRHGRNAEKMVKTSVRKAVAAALSEAATKDSGTPAPAAAAGARGPAPAVPHDQGASRPDAGQPTAPITLWQEFPTTPDPLPRHVDSTTAHGLTVRTHPALVDPGAPRSEILVPNPFTATAYRPQTRPTRPDYPLELHVFTDRVRAAWEHRFAVIELARRQWQLSPGRITSRWPGNDALTLAGAPYPTTADFVAAAQWAGAAQVVDRVCHAAGHGIVTAADIRSPQQFAELIAAGRDLFEDAVYDVVAVAVRILHAQAALARLAEAASGPAMKEILAAVRRIEHNLVGPGYLGVTPPAQLPHLPRYIQALTRRLERALTDTAKDRAGADQISNVEQLVKAEYERAIRAREKLNFTEVTRLEQARWLVEELRVQLFAQNLGTPVKVSPKRIANLLDGA